MFRITTKGDIVIRWAASGNFRQIQTQIISSDLRFMNGSTAHLVVVAEDSGVPPRRASVPVVVRSDSFFLSLMLVVVVVVV